VANTFACPSCARAVPAGDLPAGALTKCPACKQDVHVPLYASARAAGQLRCPKCTRKVEEGDRTCGFCQSPLPGPNTRRVMAEAAHLAEARARKRRPLWIALCVLWAAAALGWTGWWFLNLPPTVASPHEACRQNLRSLHSLLALSAGDGKGLPKETGAKFWSAIVKTDAGSALAGCPSWIQLGTGGYRGPSRPFVELPPEGILACDPVGPHPDGLNLLLKNGEVRFAPRGSPDYDRALRETRE